MWIERLNYKKPTGVDKFIPKLLTVRRYSKLKKKFKVIWTKSLYKMSTKGATKKQLTSHKAVRIQKEQKPICGKAIPYYVEPEASEFEMKTSDQKYASPQLNSVLWQKQEIEDIASRKVRRYTTTHDLTPRTKSTIMPKINQWLNFDTHRPVFKNLVPINVNDSLLLAKEKTSIRTKYDKSKRIKPPAPDLSDFLDPIEPLTHVIPLPNITLEFPEEEINPMEIYQRFAETNYQDALPC